MRRVLSWCALFVPLVACLAAAAVQEADTPSWEGQTFLADYSTLKPVPVKTGREYTYAAPGLEQKLAACVAVMVDQPEVSLNAASPYKSAKPDDLKAIAEFLRSTIVERMESRGFTIVEERGENVLFLRPALTDLQLKKKKRGVLAYTPAGAVLHAVKTAVQDVMGDTDIMDLTLQGELLDSQSGEVFAAIVTRRSAAPTREGGKPKPLEFEELEALLRLGSDRLACRLNNARLPVEQRIDCAALAAPSAAPQ